MPAGLRDWLNPSLASMNTLPDECHYVRFRRSWPVIIAGLVVP